MRWSLTTLMICLLCSVAENADGWAMYQHDLQHSGYSSSPMPRSLKEKWRIESLMDTGDLNLAFATSGGNLFVARYFSLYVLDIDTGTIKGRLPRIAPGLCYPAVENHMVYLNTDYGIACFDTEKGEELWWHPESLLSFLSYPIVVDGHVFIGGGEPATDIDFGNEEAVEELDRATKNASRVMCMDAETGEIIWEYFANSWTVYSPAYFNGRVYVNDGSRYVYCLDAQTGRKIWQKEVTWHCGSPLSLDGKRIFVETFKGVICLDIETGKTLWTFSYRNESYIDRTPAAAYNRVFQTVDKSLYCLNAETGEMIWKREVEDLIFSSTIVADKKVAFGTVNGTLYIVDAQTGRNVEHLNVGDSPIIALALSDGYLFIGQENGRIICLEGVPEREGLILPVILAAILFAALSLLKLWKRKKPS